MMSFSAEFKRFPLILLLLSFAAFGDEESPRARDLGIPFDGTPGELNAITDVRGVTVGHSTVIEDFADGSNMYLLGAAITAGFVY